MISQTFLHVALLTMFYGRLVISDVFVSERNGKDSASCGTRTNPCHTFEFAVKKLDNSKITVRLDGGSVEAYVYYINNSIMVDKNLSVTTYKDNKFRPIIKFADQKKNAQAYLFYMDKNTHIYLRIENIDFIEVALLEYSSSFTTTIVNCSFENAKLPIIAPFSRDYTASVTVHLSKSVIKHAKFMRARFVKNLVVTIDSSSIQYNEEDIAEAAINIYATEILQLRVSKSTLKCPFGVAIECETTSNSSIEIHDSTFSTDYNLNQTSWYGVISNECSRIAIRNSKFSGFRRSAVRAFHTSTITVNNVSFTNNKGTNGGAMHVENSNLFICHSIFSNNTAKTGGALYLYDGNKAVIVSSVFLYNSAHRSGGNVYAQRSLGDSALTLYLYSVQITGMMLRPLATGIIIHSNVNLFLTNVSASIVNAMDVTVLDALVCDGTCAVGMQEISNLSLSCPRNFDVTTSLSSQHDPRLSSIRCHRCPRGMYSIKSSNTLLNQGKKDIVVQKTSFKCFSCPPGGKCKNGIKSKERFWGYVGENDEIKFIPCLASYCCSQKTTKCTSYNTCSKNRVGILCGTCQKGYRLNFFNNNCINKNRCNIWLFWILYLAYGILYVMFLMYFKTILTYFYNVLRKLKCKRKKSQFDNHLYQYRLFRESSDDNTEEIECQRDDEDIPTNKGGSTDGENKTDFSISGFKSVIFFFYQIQVLLEVPAVEKNNHGYITKITNSISKLFNFELIHFNISKLCPTEDLDALSKALIKLGNIFILFLIILIFATGIKTIQILKRKRELTFLPAEASTNKIMENIRNCSIQITLLGYTAVNIFCFKMLNCVSVNSENHLYIQGDTKCYTWWQYSILTFTLLWIIPFPISVHVSVNMLRRNQINLRQFYLSFTIPPISLYYYLRCSCVNKRLDIADNRDGIDKIVEIFIGPYKSNQKSQLNWEAVLIGRRIIITGLCAFIINPISRTISTLLVLLSYLLHHLYVLPYRSKILNHLETASLSCLIFINIENSFFAFVYMNDQSSVPGINTIAVVFIWTEHIILTTPFVIIIAAIVFRLIKKIGSMIKNCIV